MEKNPHLLLLQLLVRDSGHLSPGRCLQPAQDLGDSLLADLLHHAQDACAEKHLERGDNNDPSGSMKYCKTIVHRCFRKYTEYALFASTERNSIGDTAPLCTPIWTSPAQVRRHLWWPLPSSYSSSPRPAAPRPRPSPWTWPCAPPSRSDSRTYISRGWGWVNENTRKKEPKRLLKMWPL